METVRLFKRKITFIKSTHLFHFYYPQKSLWEIVWTVIDKNCYEDGFETFSYCDVNFFYPFKNVPIIGCFKNIIIYILLAVNLETSLYILQPWNNFLFYF